MDIEGSEFPVIARMLEDFAAATAAESGAAPRAAAVGAATSGGDPAGNASDVSVARRRAGAALIPHQLSIELHK